jgi:hypothetical protein
MDRLLGRVPRAFLVPGSKRIGDQNILPSGICVAKIGTSVITQTGYFERRRPTVSRHGRRRAHLHPRPWLWGHPSRAEHLSRDLHRVKAREREGIAWTPQYSDGPFKRSPYRVVNAGAIPIELKLTRTIEPILLPKLGNDTVRRIRDDSIDVPQRRKHLKAIAQDQPAVAYDLFALDQCSAPKARTRQYATPIIPPMAGI